MNKKNIAIAISAFMVILVVFLIWEMGQKRAAVQDQEKGQQRNTQQQNQEEKREFVVDVDPNVDHWQTKETEFFTIKFPTEWYWLESIVSNNPDFDIAKHANIGIFSGDIYTPLVLTSNAEVVITHWGTPTSNAGTPQDSLEAIFQSAKKKDPSVDCKVTNNKTIPFTAYCFVTHDSQLQRSYYIINNKISLILTARTTKDTLVKKEILDKIANNIVLKQGL